MQPLLQFSGVSKRFGRQQALASVSFTVGAGEVVGFVGPNGAGKSTAMRIIAGLLRPGAGTVRIDGIDQHADPVGARDRVGALIENPACYPGLSARDHIAYVSRLRGTTDVDIAESLRGVGLDPASRKPVRQFSLGMKQRLGIAMATLGNPALLVLDEPMNGLDPLAMSDLREYLRTLPARTGAGVLVSSHLLSEVEQTCDRVLLIREGRLLGEAAVARGHDLVTTITLRTSDDVRAEAVLQAADTVVLSVERTAAGLTCRLHADGLGRVATLLVRTGLQVLELTPRARSLEDVYVATYGSDRNRGGLR